MTFVLLFLLSLTLAFGKAPTYLLKETPDSKSFDFNQDKKADFVERFRGNTLVESHYDSDGDGQFDRHTILDPAAEVFKIVDLDKTKKNPRKRIFFWNHELQKKTIAHVQIDKNNDGVWEISYDMSTDIDQKAETCTSGTISPPTETLAQSALEACLRAEDYVETDFGYRVHKSCLEGRPWFMEEARSALSEGLACLTGLSQRGMRGAARNLSSLESLLSNSKVQVICNEEYNWERASAHATVGAENPQTYLPLVHPGISLGPDMLSGTRTEEKNRQFRSTLFHEQLHNLGHRHGTEPEISYTCSTCCFPESYTDEADKELACKVCGGDYSSITDPQYLEDISNYAEANYGKDEALGATMAFLRENPEEGNLGLAYLAFNSSGVFNPVGSEIAYLINNRPDLTQRERNIAARATPFGFDETMNPYRPGARVIAQAYLKLYDERNPQEAFRILRENAELLKTQFALRTGKHGEYMGGSLKSATDSLLAEVWYRGYRGEGPAVTIGTEGGDELTTEGLNLKRLLGI